MKCRPLFSAMLIYLSTQDFAHSAQGKARVLVIGDSISIGYTPYLEQKLSRAAIIHSPGNAGNSVNGVEKIQKWVDVRPGWEFCLVNHGLHDIFEIDQVPLEKYVTNLGYIFKALERKCGSVMFLTSTMVPPKTSDRKNSNVILYNAAIKHFIEKKKKVKLCDLYQKSVEIPDLYRNADKQNDVHFSPKGYEELANFIIGCIRAH